MTDSHKQLIIADLDLPPKLGRPKSCNALSNAAKQKAYRQRNKQVGKKQVLFDPLELGLLRGLVESQIVDSGTSAWAQIHRVLLAKLVAATAESEGKKL